MVTQFGGEHWQQMQQYQLATYGAYGQPSSAGMYYQPQTGPILVKIQNSIRRISQDLHFASQLVVCSCTGATVHLWRVRQAADAR